MKGQLLRSHFPGSISHRIPLFSILQSSLGQFPLETLRRRNMALGVVPSVATLEANLGSIPLSPAGEIDWLFLYALPGAIMLR